VDEGPYRSAGAGAASIACPRCRGPVSGDVLEGLTCLGGCGEWWGKETLERLLPWAALEASEPDVPSLLGRPFSPVPCLTCGRTMTVSVRAAVVFDHCNAHGVWLDRNERRRFAEAFGVQPLLLER
jgi:Zn-finger nucleic acid-binding protein